MIEFVTQAEVYNPEVPDYFFPDFRFRDEEPTLNSICDVRVPAGRRLNWTTRNFPPPRTSRRATREGYDVYHWELHNVAPYIAEPMMPDPYDIVPLIQCSLFFDWRALVERHGQLPARAHPGHPRNRRTRPPHHPGRDDRRPARRRPLPLGPAQHPLPLHQGLALERLGRPHRHGNPPQRLRRLHRQGDLLRQPM